MERVAPVPTGGAPSRRPGPRGGRSWAGVLRPSCRRNPAGGRNTGAIGRLSVAVSTDEGSILMISHGHLSYTLASVAPKRAPAKQTTTRAASPEPRGQITKDRSMTTLYRTITSTDDAENAIERVLTAGMRGTGIHLIIGDAIKDSRDAPIGTFAGTTTRRCRDRWFVRQHRTLRSRSEGSFRRRRRQAAPRRVSATSTSLSRPPRCQACFEHPTSPIGRRRWTAARSRHGPHSLLADGAPTAPRCGDAVGRAQPLTATPSSRSASSTRKYRTPRL